MRFIYKTDNPIEAHAITHMLEQHGIMAQIFQDRTDHAGYPGVNMSARIGVINEEAEEATKLIKSMKETIEKESQTIECEGSIHPSSFLFPRISVGMVFLLCVIIGALITYYYAGL